MITFFNRRHVAGSLFLTLVIACISTSNSTARAVEAADQPTPLASDAVWQWSVPAPSIPDRRAYLWIAPDCRRVRGIIVACHNMLEKPLFERDAFRAAAAENGLAILMIFPGHDRIPADEKPDHPKRSALDIFLNPNYPKGDEDPAGAGVDLQKVLDALADVSGYSELRWAPLLPVGHSSAGSFVWHLYRWNPSRIFAMMPFKTGPKSDGPEGIPVFDVNSEWFDYGHESNNCSTDPGSMRGALDARNGGKCLLGYYVDIGSGHCNVSDDCMPIVAAFLKSAVAARIPDNAPLDGPVNLKPVTAESGWLLDAKTFGQAEGKPVAYADFTGDPTKAFWYLDQALAALVQNHMVEQRAKQPQQINFFTGSNSPSTNGGMYSFSPKFLDDAGTFRVEATYIDRLNKSNLYPPGTTLTHGDEPIKYRVNSGAVVQVGPDTFRIRPHAGPYLPQGNPWEPTINAYLEGDADYRPTVRPAHINVNIVNTSGEPQTIDFPAIPDQTAGSANPVPLAATASSKLPVQYIIISGPVQLGQDGASLVVLPMPPRTKFPLTVRIEAFQWGRPGNPKVQTAPLVVREFQIRPAGNQSK